MGELALCLCESGAGMADGDGDEFHFAPNSSKCVDERGVLGGLYLEALVASEDPAEELLADDEVARSSVKSRRVRFRCVRGSSGVDEVGSRAVTRREEGVLGLDGEDPFRDADRCLSAFRVAACGDRCVSHVLGDICVSVMPCVGVLGGAARARPSRVGVVHVVDEGRLMP